MQISIADLQEIDVTGDEIAFKIEREPAIAVIRDVFLRKVHGNLNGDSRGIVDQHELLESLMALLVRDCRRKHESREPRCIVFFPRDGNRELRGEFRGAVFGGLKNAVRKIFTDRFEIIFCGSEMAVACVLEQKFELRSMQLETVHLSVAQKKTANHRVCVKKLPPDGAQASVSRERSIRSYPGPDRTFGNVDMQPLTDRALRIAYGVAKIVGRDRFEDRSGRVRFVSSCGCGEFVETLSALEDLQDSEAVLSPAFLHGEF